MAPPAPDLPHAEVQQLDRETSRRLFRLTGEISIQWVAGLLGALVVAGFANVWSIGRYFAKLESTQQRTAEELKAVKDTDVRHDATLTTTSSQLAAIQRDIAAQADMLREISGRIVRIEDRRTQ